MREKKILVYAGSLVILGLAVVTVHGQGQEKAPGWKADPEAVKKLGAAVAVEGYTIKVPRGYELQDTGPGTATMKISAWAGPRRKDMTRASLLFNVVTIPPAEAEKYKSMKLEQLSERLNRTLKTKQQNWKQDPLEKSFINGIEFARIHWTGSSIEFNREMYGFSYVGIDGGRILQLTSQDMVPDLTKALAIAEAAVLSLKKK